LQGRATVFRDTLDFPHGDHGQESNEQQEAGEEETE
jgi:hypothetical protein